MLRFLDASHSLPIIMLTADATPEARAESMDAGSDAFLTKPINAKALLGKIAALTNPTSTMVSKLDTPAPVSLHHAQDENASIVDLHAIEELAKLGDSSTFIEDLVFGFLRDGKKQVQRIKKSSNNDYPELREALHALKGSSTELGARELAEFCLMGEAFKPYQLGSPEMVRYIGEIDEVFASTEEILVKITKSINLGNFQDVNKDHGAGQ